MEGTSVNTNQTGTSLQAGYLTLRVNRGNRWI
jgi:hypothetical protein